MMLDMFRSILLYYLHSLLPLCWRPTAQQLGLVSLPVEILAEAFAYLDFPGVLAVKLVRYILPHLSHLLIFWRYIDMQDVLLGDKNPAVLAQPHYYAHTRTLHMSTGRRTR
jgi:hypothetical protein